MDAFRFIFWAVIILVAVVSWLRKVRQAMAEQAKVAQQGRPEYEATPDEVTEFLRSLESVRGQQAAVEARPAQRATPARPPRAAPAAPAGMWEEPGGETTARLVAPVEQEPAVREARRTRRPRAAARPQPPQQQQQPKQPQQPPKVAAAVPLAAKGTSLKQAVIWSEILGRPVSMRGPRSHVPPIEKP